MWLTPESSVSLRNNLGSNFFPNVDAICSCPPWSLIHRLLTVEMSFPSRKYNQISLVLSEGVLCLLFFTAFREFWWSLDGS